MSKGLIAEFTRPEHLGDPYLGAWLARLAFSAELAGAVMNEVYGSGQVEPIRYGQISDTNQKFERLVVDLTREHEFPHLEQLAYVIGSHAVANVGPLFPGFGTEPFDEAAVQIYPAGTELALGWHRDHKNDGELVASATLRGGGEVSFTEKTYEEAKLGVAPEEVVARIQTQPLDVLFLRANGLYERADGSDIRETHAVTKINPGDPRFTIQFRRGVNASAYGNVPVNEKSPLRLNRPRLSVIQNQ